MSGTEALRIFWQLNVSLPFKKVRNTCNLYVILYLKILEICTSKTVITAKSSIDRNISYLTEI